MKIVVLTVLIGLAGCAAQNAATRPPATFAGPAARVVELPASAGEGQPREVHALVEEETLKIVTIVLRRGERLPEHHSPAAVTIQALSGAGAVTAGSERFRIDPTHAVVLAPRVPHAVEPDAGADLVLLVHHAGVR